MPRPSKGRCSHQWAGCRAFDKSRATTVRVPGIERIPPECHTEPSHTATEPCSTSNRNMLRVFQVLGRRMSPQHPGTRYDAGGAPFIGHTFAGHAKREYAVVLRERRRYPILVRVQTMGMQDNNITRHYVESDDDPRVRVNRQLGGNIRKAGEVARITPKWFCWIFGIKRSSHHT